MSWIESQPEGLLRDWLVRTHAPMMATLPDGSILWVNRAFEDLLGYTSPELVGVLTWKYLTDDLNDLEVDLQLAAEAISGQRTSYSLQKPYRTKSGPVKRVVIDVQRYPTAGEFRCFLVTAIPTDRGIEFAMGQLADMRELLLKVAQDRRGVTIDKAIALSKAHPIATTFLSLLFGSLLFGDRVFEIVQLIRGAG